MKLDIELLKETGVQGKSIGHLFTPLPTAKALYFYITQIGHYYCTHTYTIRRDYFSPILVICVKKGCLYVDYRGASYRLMAGDAVLVDCREPHYYYADMDGLEFYYVHFEGSNAHEICQHILELRGPLVESQNAAALSAFLEKTVQFYEDGRTETEFEESFRVYQILKYLHGGSAQDTARASYIDQVTAFINENIGRRITLEELADLAAMSSFHFSRKFKRDTGFSPLKYVNRMKLEYAKTLLIRTDWTISEIAERTGFSPKGFDNLFSQMEGMPPLVWRKSRQLNVSRPE